MELDLDALNAEQAKHWRADQPDGLLGLLRWMDAIRARFPGGVNKKG